MGCGGGHDKRLQKIGEGDAGRVQRLAEAAVASDIGVGIDVYDPQFALARLPQIEASVAAGKLSAAVAVEEITAALGLAQD